MRVRCSDVDAYLYADELACLVSRREILDLFNNLIGTPPLCWSPARVLTFRLLVAGDIIKSDELFDRGRRYYVLTFATQDAAK